ncbi:MAG TPA: FAD-dependent oxidoreductase [Chloroflexota bacterium]
MASKPVILTLDDDTDVLQAIERDLRRHFGRDYRVIASDDGNRALDTLRRLTLRNDTAALMLVDQRMPRMTGVEFLEEARAIYPDAKRVLLTAYADTEAAIRAINTVSLDYYLLKPWDPPEQYLYPILDDLLDDWRADYRPPSEGVRVIGHQWSAASHQARSFLAGNQVAYRWLDVERDPDATRLLTNAGLDGARLPVVIFPDGAVLQAPSNVEIADKVGLRTHTATPFHDLIIVGGGPSGLAAAVYGASEGLDTVLVEREAPGGQAGSSSRIENYLGFPAGLSGRDLARRGVAQAERFGVEILTPQEVTGLRVDGPYRYVRLTGDDELSCHALLICTGVSYRKLQAPGIEQLEGAGVYYGSATTEALSCQGDDVYIVGGANSAGQGAVYLANYARRVTILVRDAGLASTMSQYLVDQINATDNIEVRPYSGVAEAVGEEHLEALVIEDLRSGDRTTESARALFVFIGAAPRTDWVDGVLKRDAYGFILAGPDLMHDGKPPAEWPLEREPYLLETNVPGVFVAGDVRSGSIKRIAAAVGQGSVAVMFIHQYLATLR